MAVYAVNQVAYSTELQISLFSPCNPLFIIHLFTKKNCTLLYYIKNNTLK